MSATLDVTVAIITWNRKALLADTLSTLCRVRVPSGVTWECLIVDNNSTDGTRESLSSFEERLPIRLVREPTQGIATSRNCAIREARGDLLLCIDDDVRASEGWMEAYVTAAKRWPNADYFGGRIHPRFTNATGIPPRWVSANLTILAGPFGIREFGATERLFPPDENPYGANMAFRRHALEGHSFDASLGHRGAERGLGEETAFLKVLREAGTVGVWVPEASVLHAIDVDQLSPQYVRRHFCAFGHTAVQFGQTHFTWVLRYPRWLVRFVSGTARAVAVCLRVIGITLWVKLVAWAGTVDGMLDETAY